MMVMIAAMSVIAMFHVMLVVSVAGIAKTAKAVK